MVTDPRAAAEGPGGVEWIDNHCHLPDEDADSLVAEANAAGVIAAITVGTSVAESARCVALAAGLPGVWATAGVHPHDASGGIAGLEELVSVGTVVAVGECGLDYYYEHSPRADQRKVFAAQIALAHRFDLPLVIHSRDVWNDTFEVLAAEGVPRRTVFHCFTGGPPERDRGLELGILLSISGIVTFGSASELREAVAGAPLGALMVETDSPYLAPVPHRGRRNRPALVVHVGHEVASLLGRPVEEVAAATTANVLAFYGLDAGARST